MTTGAAKSSDIAKKPSFWSKNKGKIIGGIALGALVLVGIGIIVATMGAATPLVVAGGVVGAVGLAGIVGGGAMAAGFNRDKKVEQENKRFKDIEDRAKQAITTDDKKPQQQMTMPQVGVPLSPTPIPIPFPSVSTGSSPTAVSPPQSGGYILQLDEHGNVISDQTAAPSFAPSSTVSSLPPSTAPITDTSLSGPSSQVVMPPLPEVPNPMPQKPMPQKPMPQKPMPPLPNVPKVQNNLSGFAAKLSSPQQQDAKQKKQQFKSDHKEKKHIVSRAMHKIGKRLSEAKSPQATVPQATVPQVKAVALFPEQLENLKKYAKQHNIDIKLDQNPSFDSLKNFLGAILKEPVPNIKIISAPTNTTSSFYINLPKEQWDKLKEAAAQGAKIKLNMVNPTTVAPETTAATAKTNYPPPPPPLVSHNYPPPPPPLVRSHLIFTPLKQTLPPMPLTLPEKKINQFLEKLNALKTDEPGLAQKIASVEQEIKSLQQQRSEPNELLKKVEKVIADNGLKEKIESPQSKRFTAK